MGIDRHELEHRNWRSSAPLKTIGNADERPEDFGTSIVPDEIVSADSDTKSTPSRSRAKRAKAH